MPRWQIDRLVARKQQADEHYVENRLALRRRAEEGRLVRQGNDWLMGGMVSSRDW
jgi:hypothetical protein